MEIPNMALRIAAGLILLGSGKRTMRDFRIACLLACILPAVAVAAPKQDSAPADSQTAEEVDDLPMSLNNPGSIVERLEEDAEPADYLFQFPGVSSAC